MDKESCETNYNSLSNTPSIFQPDVLLYLIHTSTFITSLLRVSVCFIYTIFRENLLLHAQNDFLFTMMFYMLHWLCHGTQTIKLGRFTMIFTMIKIILNSLSCVLKNL